ncbi:MAG: hypothetical protein ACK40Q_02325 [Pseudothermotoga sp.]
MPLDFPTHRIKRITHITVIVLEHVFGGLAGTSLVNWIIGRNIQDLWYWVSDIGLWPWALGIASLITGILLLIRLTIRQPKLQRACMLLITIGLVSLVFVAVAWAPHCGALMRFQVRAVAQDLSGGCIGSYATNGRAFFKFEKVQSGGKAAYYVLSVDLKTIGTSEETPKSGVNHPLDFNSGIVISLPDKEGWDFSQATTLQFRIKFDINSPRVLGIGAKDIYGTEIKIVKSFDSAKEEWISVIIDLKNKKNEFAYGNFKVEMAHLNAITFFTTNVLSGDEWVKFSVADLRFLR